ncbi:alpha-isopropylmalate synthase regulatory domain-containing protein [Staphylococcus aureus]|nr:alpha-isopropylmalate synthase regulatory domain-containing protein [Staphylococcus aureus]
MRLFKVLSMSIKHFINWKHCNYNMSLAAFKSAVVVVKDKEGHIYQDSSIGTGSIVAIYNAVDRIFQKETELIDYRINSVTEGTDAQAEVHVNLLIEGKTVNGFGIDQ